MRYFIALVCFVSFVTGSNIYSQYCPYTKAVPNEPRKFEKYGNDDGGVAYYFKDNGTAKFDDRRYNKTTGQCPGDCKVNVRQKRFARSGLAELRRDIELGEGVIRGQRQLYSAASLRNLHVQPHKRLKWKHSKTIYDILQGVRGLIRNIKAGLVPTKKQKKIKSRRPYRPAKDMFNYARAAGLLKNESSKYGWAINKPSRKSTKSVFEIKSRKFQGNKLAAGPGRRFGPYRPGQWPNRRGGSIFRAGDGLSRPAGSNFRPGVGSPRPVGSNFRPGVGSPRPGAWQPRHLRGQNNLAGWPYKPAVGQNRPVRWQDRPSIGQNRPGVYQNRPAVGQNRPGVYQNRPAVGQNRPGVYQNRPAVGQNRPGVYQNRPAVGQNGTAAKNYKPGGWKHRIETGQYKPKVSPNIPAGGHAGSASPQTTLQSV